MITYPCNGTDMSLSSFGDDVTKFGITIGQWMHIVAINGNGSVTYQGNRIVSSEDVPLISELSSEARLFAHDAPHVAEDLSGHPVVSVIGNDPRDFIYGDPKINSPYVMMKRPDWSALSYHETSVPNVVSGKFIPIVGEDNNVTALSDEAGDLVVKSVSRFLVTEISRLEDFRLVDAVPYGDDILVSAVWTAGGYLKQSLTVDQFNGGTFTFWRHAPFVFILRKSESFAYFNSFSSTNETPFPLISMNSGTVNAIATDGSQVFITSVVNHAGVWRQAVSYCNEGGEWDMMNSSVFPFSDFSAVTPRCVCDVSYDAITGDPVAMFLTDHDLSVRMYNSSSSAWSNWRGYDIVCITDGVDVPSPTSSSSSNSSSSSSNSSSSSSV